MIEFRVFGGVEVCLDGHRVDVGPARQRCVLAVLLVDANTAVSVDQLVDRVWADQPPLRVRSSLHSYLTRLRRALAAVPVNITQRSGNYVLTVDEQTVDLHRFRHLVGLARASGDDEQALALTEQALGLWRGDPLAGLDNSWSHTVRAALQRERLEAVRDHTDLKLRAGQHTTLVPALSTQADQDPLDERLAGQLMLALYRSGRQADALRVFQDTRQTLVAELGVDPSPPLRQLHRRILTGDPTLAEAPAPRRPPAPSAGRTEAPAHNLPAELTRFVGREEELAVLEPLVLGRRLVTLAGAGGCGKTRLAVRLGLRLADRWPDGVWLVDLGPVTDPARVPALAATALGVPVEPGGDPVRALADRLRTRKMLVCLDTCEHLLDAVAALVDTVLRDCPDVVVLATSREPLGVAGETVWRVPPMKEDEAVELFADRASLVVPEFDAHATRAEVRALCSRLDNLPLAVELAAAWVRVMPPARIAVDLDDRFRLLAGGPRRTVPRHRTLEASMAWSHALLTAEEKIVFRRMAVFSGFFTLEALDAVCGGDGILGHGSLGMVGRLVDKSLVSVREGEDRCRYRLLETVRQYAAERLRAAGELDAVRDRHLDHYLARVESAGLATDEDTWRWDHDNIDAALEWGMAAPGDRPDRAARGRRLAAEMVRQWFVHGQVAAPDDNTAARTDDAATPANPPGPATLARAPCRNRASVTGTDPSRTRRTRSTSPR